MKILVTGGAGFIGSAVIRHLINDLDYQVVNIDKLTYAGNLESLESITDSPNYTFQQIDICNSEAIRRALQTHLPDKIMHLAAESHVDRSIDSPNNFIQTNITGTYTLLEEAKNYWSKLLSSDKKSQFRFHHVSTDEVYGELNQSEQPFTEEHPYAPNSPYSASKASADHLVRAWHRTYQFPVVLSNCSNNYGPYQFPEKLIPLTILNVLKGAPIPVYGKGDQVRDWLYVEDHAKALAMVMEQGRVGENYNIGGYNEKTNLEVVKTICSTLDHMAPSQTGHSSKHESLITFVADRPGHDFRYAIDASKIYDDLGWKPSETFETGIRKTVQWYLDNQRWWEHVLDGSYQGGRLGLDIS